MIMKKCYSLLTVLILFFISAPIFSQLSGALLFEIQEDQLQKSLQLTPEQSESLKEIIRILGTQEKLDRQNFSGNALALVAAAVRRAQMAEFKLVSDLTDSQKKILMQIKEKQQKNREFFSLKEGLLLTQEQCGKVKALLQAFANKPLERRISYDPLDTMGYGYGYGNSFGYGPGYGYGSGYGLPGSTQGYLPGNRLGNRTGSLTGGMNNARRTNPAMMNEDLIESLRIHEAEKEEAIEKLLTPEQKKLFSQLKEARKKELQKMMDDIRENRNSQ